MEYLLKVSAVIIVFYGIYRLFLQRDTFFEANRWFLISGILMSFTIPLIVIPVYHEYIPREESINSIESFQEVVMLMPTVVDKPFDLLDYLPMVYALGIIIFSLRFFFRLISLASVIKKNKSHKKEGYIFTETTTELSPFSFFKWIVYNPTQFNQNELAQIITHEKVHAKQYHSIDILLMEICCVFLWFHPFVWLYNKSLKQNLEFLADKYALNQFNDTKCYQYTLLKVSVPNHQVALSNHFYNSLIKKRIAMLQKSKSKKINLLKYALVVPALALFLMSFNTEDVYEEKKSTEIINPEKEEPKKRGYLQAIKETISLLEMISDIKTDDSSTDLEREEEAKRITLKYAASSMYILNGKEITKKEFENLDIDDTDAISILRGDKSFINKYGEKAAKGVVVIETKKFQEINTIEQIKRNPKDSVPENSITMVKTPLSDKNPLYIIDGKEISDEEFKKINPDDIDNITVLKDKHATEKYGEKGKNGVVEITMKKDNDSTTQVSKSYPDIKVVSYGDGVKTESLGIKQRTIELDAKDLNLIKNPLYIIDGEEVSDEEFKKINPDDIQSINVLKDKHATDKYGEKGKDGVIEITMKKKKK